MLWGVFRKADTRVCSSSPIPIAGVVHLREVGMSWSSAMLKVGVDPTVLFLLP